MTSRDGNVIRFPTWRRAASGAPGVSDDLGDDSPASGEDGGHEDWTQGWRPQPTPRVENVDGLDKPVWHEGASVHGESVVRLRADIVGFKPPIWRRLEVRGSLTLTQVHPVLAAAFGWVPESEYVFREVLRRTGRARVGRVFANEWSRDRARGRPQEWTVRLDRVLAEPRDRLRYVYGRAGGFDVTLVAEDVMPLPPAAAGGTPGARLLTGRRSGPPPEFTSRDLYDLALSGMLDRPGISDLFDVALPPGFDPEHVDLALLDARVRAAADS